MCCLRASVESRHGRNRLLGVGVGLDLGGRVRRAARALRHRDFRVYWFGQAVSVTGLWMQTMALSWLVYRLTDSPLYLGLLAVARFGPVCCCRRSPASSPTGCRAATWSSRRRPQDSCGQQRWRC
jgi:hypothetical protein